MQKKSTVCELICLSEARRFNELREIMKLVVSLEVILPLHFS
jgi:hypothetical protein